MRPWTLTEIDQALRASFAADTCSPDDFARAGWHQDNPSWGHCDVTALVVNDLLGGDLVVGEVHHGGEHICYHWWNRLPNGVELDLTREQFVHDEVVSGARVVHRPPGPLPHRWAEYLLLRERLTARLGPLPAPAGSTPEGQGPVPAAGSSPGHLPPTTTTAGRSNTVKSRSGSDG
ncbi:YunG family protein [Wenjunlia vitaminophila]|uniref:YunG family protein n=1 Tax=Wenjunlia vitaminophila TaxID=76728 RepID=UPI00036488C1|nr:hypothetical protein [Wenjunlia vitaminophila]